VPQDNIEIEVLADGSIKFTTDPISGPNHMSAEKFLRDTAQAAGGETKRVKRINAKIHVHDHTHEGEHNAH
jgi:hypothetical protein